MLRSDVPVSVVKARPVGRIPDVIVTEPVWSTGFGFPGLNLPHATAG